MSRIDHCPFGNEDNENPTSVIIMSREDSPTTVPSAIFSIVRDVWAEIFSFLPLEDIAIFLRVAKTLAELTGDIADNFCQFPLERQHEFFLKIINGKNFYNKHTLAFRNFICIDSVFFSIFYVYRENPLADTNVYIDRGVIKKIVDMSTTTINDTELQRVKTLYTSFERAIGHSKEIGVKLHPKKGMNLAFTIFLFINFLLTGLFLNLIFEGKIKGNVTAAISFNVIAGCAVLFNSMCLVINFLAPGVPALRWLHPTPDFDVDNKTRETPGLIEKKLGMVCSFFRDIEYRASEIRTEQENAQYLTSLSQRSELPSSPTN